MLAFYGIIVGVDQVREGFTVYLKKSTNHKTGRTYLSVVESYYDKESKSSRTKTIESIGYLDELCEQYEDPIAHFSAYVDKLKKTKKEEPVTLAFSTKEKLEVGTNLRKNFGYVVLSVLYHELEIDKFLINRQRSTKINANTNDVMKLLVFSRLLCPASKRKTYESKDRYFDKHSYLLDDIYRSLTFFNLKGNELHLWINDRIKEYYNRDTSLVYYDVTNYYFETDKQDELRRKGVSKEHRPNHIVQMGLFMDTNGIPITYDLYSGNTNDCLTYRPTLAKIKKQYNLGKTIIVADKAMSTGDNIYYTLSAKDSYVFSISVRGVSKEIKEFVLDQQGYQWLGKEYKRKERCSSRTIKVTGTSGTKFKKTVHEKQIVFYSEKYAKRARIDRAAAIEKAKKLIQSPGSYTRSTSYGAAGYVKNIQFKKDTGEVLDTGQALSLDEKKIRQEEKFDGYYLIVTNECKLLADKVIDIYRGLWKIEESFKVPKSDLETRSIYVSSKEHIKAHFLTCFVALVLARILEHKLNHKHSISKVLDSLQKCSCSNLQLNYYFFDYYDEVLEDLGDIFSIDFSQKMRTLKEIKKILASTKKG